MLFLGEAMQIPGLPKTVGFGVSSATIKGHYVSGAIQFWMLKGKCVREGE